MADKEIFKITPEDLISEIKAPPIGTDVYHYIIPTDKNKIYDIDLNTRTINVPKFLSVVEDHNSSVIWFRVNRFFDDIDLFGVSCWIEYRNALKQEFICVTYPKPYVYDNHEFLYIPWPITKAVTEGSGNIEFSLRFFKLSENVEEVTDELGNKQELRKVIFSLNTKPATGKILDGLRIGPYEGFLDPDLVDENFIPQRAELTQQLENILASITRLNNDYTLYWREVK